MFCVRKGLPGFCFSRIAAFSRSFFGLERRLRVWNSAPLVCVRARVCVFRFQLLLVSVTVFSSFMCFLEEILFVVSGCLVCSCCYI
jgi:hypothetical protein